MTPARVRACSRLASRAIKPGASAAWRSNTLRFTTMMVSILGAGAWPDRRTGEPAVRSAAIVPTASPPLRQTALFEQVNSLMQRIAHVAGGVVPFRKIQGRVHATRDLPQPARRERERAADRVRLQDRKSTRLNSSHPSISYAVFCLKKKTTHHTNRDYSFKSIN